MTRWAAVLLTAFLPEAFHSLASAQCNFQFDPPDFRVGPAQFSHTIRVYANTNCGWTAQSLNPDWAQIIVGGSGIGNGQFVLRLLENVTPFPRTARITIPGVTYPLTVTQDGAACTYILSPTSTRVTTPRGAGTFFITSRCSWSPSTEASWIRINAPGSTGITTTIGNGAVVYDYEENTAIGPRSALITIAPGVSFRLTQDGTFCNVELPVSSQGVGPQGGSFGFDVLSDCGWDARPLVSWLRFDEPQLPGFAQGMGNRRLRFTAQPNTSSYSRTGSLAVGNKVFSVTQSGVPCSYTVSPGSVNLTSNAAETSFRVNAPETCVWTAVPNEGWMTAIPGAGTGSGTVTLSVLANSGSATRTGVVTVQGVTFGVVQSAVPNPELTTVWNAASLSPAAVSPGMIVQLIGQRLGPAQEVEAKADVDTFTFRDTLEGVKVFFDDVPAPILAASAARIKAVAPFALAGRNKVNVSVEYNGRRTRPLSVEVAPASPGIFTLNENGAGPALARTEDYNFSDASNPIPLGSEMILYLTGEGVSDPPGVDGRIVGEQLTRPIQPVRVFLGEMQLENTFVGSTPGQVTGMLQVNVRVPYTAPVGNAVPLTVWVGSYKAQDGVTVSVK